MLTSQRLPCVWMNCAEFENVSLCRLIHVRNSNTYNWTTISKFRECCSSTTAVVSYHNLYYLPICSQRTIELSRRYLFLFISVWGASHVCFCCAHDILWQPLNLHNADDEAAIFRLITFPDTDCTQHKFGKRLMSQFTETPRIMCDVKWINRRRWYLISCV